METVGDILADLPPKHSPEPWKPGDDVQFHAVEQGTPEWFEARRGLITASEMDLLFTTTRKPAENEKLRLHLFELAAQRITGRVEPRFIGDAAIRGHVEEEQARAIYSQHIAPVQQVGFITRDFSGMFRLGYSPDGLVGDAGLIECKSRVAKYQVQTIANMDESVVIPPEYVIQLQCGLLVTGRQWIDFVSYSNGMPMIVARVEPDTEVHALILETAAEAEKRIAGIIERYKRALQRPYIKHAIETTWRDYGEDILA